ncbi:CoA transferase [Rhodococcus sp. 14-2470-1a]|uniref:CoA transferase n=1 Tax=Rhodococcus sp. 14-2470-1a TaxID=2023150 RepID=UPI000B9B1E47|nr:CoA transferase [Rhodococcus sp. 14-2470-1a]OZF51646.1 hypothetical protein CH292_10825 [Rhodococcus sp. 14-2470-1a]
MTFPQVGNAGSLSGVVVLDLSHVLAGAYAAQMFADFGATVVKIENPTQACAYSVTDRIMSGDDKQPMACSHYCRRATQFPLFTYCRQPHPRR